MPFPAWSPVPRPKGASELRSGRRPPLGQRRARGRARGTPSGGCGSGSGGSLLASLLAPEALGWERERHGVGERRRAAGQGGGVPACRGAGTQGRGKRGRFARWGLEGRSCWRSPPEALEGSWRGVGGRLLGGGAGAALWGRALLLPPSRGRSDGPASSPWIPVAPGQRGSEAAGDGANAVMKGRRPVSPMGSRDFRIRLGSPGRVAPGAPVCLASSWVWVVVLWC